MNSRNIEMLIEKSDAAMIRMVIWFIVANVGMFWLVIVAFNPPPQVLGFAVPALMFAVGWFIAIVYAFKYARLNDMMGKLPPRPPRVTTLESEAHNRAVRLEARPRENQLLRSRHAFSPSDWRLLVHHLQPNYPKWTRRALEKTRLFDKITAPGQFEDVCAEFERLGVITGKMYQWRITPEGWHDLREAANLHSPTPKRT